MEFRNTIRFMRWRKQIAVVTLSVVLLGVVSLFTRGLNLGLDFTGGTSVEVAFAKAVELETVRTGLTQAGIQDAVVQHLGQANEVLVRLPPQGRDVNVGGNIVKALAGDGSNPVTLRQVDSVGSQVGEEMYWQSVGAVLLALAVMMIFVAVRYRLKFAVGAVIALLHDVLFTVGVFSIFQWPFDLTVLAAVLSLIGSSLNDTIVVFDRVRENFRKLRNANPVEIVDISLTETLSRTIMTVGAVFVVVLALLLVGGPALKWFSVAMLVGLFIGTYSSIYIATSYALAMGLNKADFVVDVKKMVDDRP